MKRNSSQAAGSRREARIDGPVLQQIRQHARGSVKTEVCGVLIGREAGSRTEVHAAIAGSGAEQGGTHVTFTQDTWEHIYRIKDRDYPEERIVGWYHSHPGFGVFLSDHDTFIHKNFFSSPGQLAWVYDPISDEEGCFGWQGEQFERLERLETVTVVDAKGGEGAGETGKPEPMLMGAGDESEVEAPPKPGAKSGSKSGGGKNAAPAMDEQTSRLLNWTLTLLLTLASMAGGGLLCWYFYPHFEKVYVLIDTRTGQVETLTEREMKMLMDQQQRAQDHPQPPVAPNPPTKGTP